MRRGAIFIGVDKTGNAPVLQDAAKGARRMAELWAEGQKFEYLKLLTDEGRKRVTAKMIMDAALEAIDGKGVEQLIVYFAGHGINRNRGEYWLLSGAPDNPNEAVNLSGTIDLAYACGVGHVVFFSDACRTAAASIQADSVTGSLILPNRNQKPKPVDVFFACQLGMPSAEVKDPRESAARFKALYTELLIPALNGEVKEILEWKDTDGYVHPYPLADHLEEAMVERLTALGERIDQEPNARIGSRSTAFISMFTREVSAAPIEISTTSFELAYSIDRVDRSRSPLPMRVEPPTPRKRRKRPAPTLFQAVLNNPSRKARDVLEARQKLPGAEDLVRYARETAEPFGPTHQETRCGFKIRGGAIVDALALHGKAEVSRGGPGDVVRIERPQAPGSIVLLIFSDGSGTVLPAIPEFMCSLTMTGGELADVSYEPSEYTARWQSFQYEAREIRALRAIASASSRKGAFLLERKDADALARRMQMMKESDPAMAVYAAYAYNDQRRLKLLDQMEGYMRRSYGGVLFDVAMLARKLEGEVGGASTMYSFAPLLAQGWAYLEGRGIKLPRGLEGLPATLEDSLWTLFKPEGVTSIREYIEGKRR